VFDIKNISNDFSQFAANPTGVRTSLPLSSSREGAPPSHVTCHPPPSPRAEGPAGRSTAAHTQHPSPRQTTSPSCGDGRHRQAGTLLASHASPSEWVDGVVSCAGPTWASVVQNGAQPRPSPPILPPIPLSTPTATVTRDEFLALYERCVASGLKARFTVRYVAGVQEASLTCSLSATNLRHQRPHHQAPPSSSLSPRAGCNHCHGCTASSRRRYDQ
jgi:hypothetical protein